MRVEETTKVATIHEPQREKMFVTTDENGRLKMLPLRAQAIQHDHEIDPSANVNLHLSQTRLPLPHVDDPSPPPGPPLANQVPHRTHPHADTSYPLIGPSTRQLTGHIQNA